MKRKVYIETSIASYLTARSSANPLIYERQEMTRLWWLKARPHFDAFISELVIRECARGDKEAAAKRLQQLSEVPLVNLTDEVRDLARTLVERRIVPPKASEDALHVAVATHYGLDFLLTWNCRHIANGEVMRRLEEYCLENGLTLPILCTPQQLVPDWEV